MVAAAAVAGAIFILYWCAISLAERELVWGFALVWPIAGTILLACARYPRRVAAFFARPAFRKRAVLIPVAIFAAPFLSISLVFFARIVSYPREAPGDASGNAPLYVIVLGGGVHRDGSPSTTLAMRLEAAAAFARGNPGAKLVVTGGRLPKKPESEADAMARWLVENGRIGDERIIREREARDTIQNFAYSLALIEAESNRPEVAVVTSEFHLNRSIFIARRAGLDRVIPLPAPSPALMAPNNYLREVGAWWKLSIRLALSLDAAAILELARR
jgi:uncharacterized SAM-binding protein YcdF (DUF218 family)